MEYNDSLSIENLLALDKEGAFISNEYYHSLPGISGSALTLLEESPKHYENKHLFSMGDQAHFALGSYTHELVLEPHMSSYAVMPSFDGRTTVGKADKAAWIANNSDKIIIPADDYDKAQKMAKNVIAICGDIIKSSICERSLFVEYQPGIILKCRIDAQNGADDYDLKTITPKNGMDEWELKRHAEKLGYYKSAALRNIVREALGMPTRGSYLIFVSTSPGHMVKLREIPHEEIIKATYQVKTLIESWADYINYGLNTPTKELFQTTKEGY
jgi:hypothetical protein